MVPRLAGDKQGLDLLSGLLTCGCCGGGYTIIGADRYGCAAVRSKGTCSNRKTITKTAIEARVLGGLRERMLAPELVVEFVEEFAAECARLNRDRASEETKLHKERGAVERSLNGIMGAIEGGAWNEILRVRLTELETRRMQIDAELATAVVPAPVTLHPNAAGLYAARVGELEAALNDPDLIVEATRTIKSLVQQIVLTPNGASANGLAVELHGDLALILSLASGGTGRRGTPATSWAHNEKLPTALANDGAKGSQLTVVAGTGFEPVAFRL